jgi:hypothetical protein
VCDMPCYWLGLGTKCPAQERERGELAPGEPPPEFPCPSVCLGPRLVNVVASALRQSNFLWPRREDGALRCAICRTGA